MEGTVYGSVRIVHLNKTAVGGGAARAAYRLLQGERSIGIDARMLVQQALLPLPFVTAPEKFHEKLLGRTAALLDRKAPLLLGTPPADYWSLCCFPAAIPQQVKRLAPDIVHLHWVGDGFLPIHELKRIPSPLVWTLHDSWAFTGGCHLPADCSRFRERCGSCPQLSSRKSADLSRWSWNRKYRAWHDLDLTVVSPSRWLADRARESSLFRARRIEVIPNGIDTAVFKPLDRQFARQALNLPPNKKIILAGSMDFDLERKGARELIEAIRLLPGDLRDDAVLVVVGSSPRGFIDLPLESVYLETRHDDVAMALTYAAADLYVHPSRQENLSNMIMEAMACGVPVVAFAIGGNGDMIDDRLTGRLVKPFDSGEFAECIQWVLEDEERRRTLAESSREKVCRDYDLQAIASRYKNLYEDILGSKRAGAP